MSFVGSVRSRIADRPIASPQHKPDGGQRTMTRQGAGAANAGSSTLTMRDGTEIFYKDWGSGQPLFFHHGWPLSADDWDAQMMFFLEHGYRVIAHDRRGHGRSTQTVYGHDMDTYAADVAELVDGARSQERGPHRPLDRRRRGHALRRAARQGPRGEGGAHQRDSADLHADRRATPTAFRRRSSTASATARRTTARSSTRTSRCRSTASTVRAPWSRRGFGRTGGGRA